MGEVTTAKVTSRRHTGKRYPRPVDAGRDHTVAIGEHTTRSLQRHCSIPQLCEYQPAENSQPNT
jgi:hypothetical protein